MEELEIDPKNNKPASTEFMLEEYKMLQGRFHSLRNEANSRLNFFITLASATIGIVIVFWGNPNFLSNFVKIAMLLALFVLAVIGYDVFRFMVTRDRVTDRVEKGMGRVRRYFVDNDPEVAKYLIYQYDDEPTNFVIYPSRSGMRRTALVLRALTVGLFSGIGSNLINLSLEISIFLAAFLFVVDFLWLRQIAINKLKAALDKSRNEVRFEYPP